MGSFAAGLSAALTVGTFVAASPEPPGLTLEDALARARPSAAALAVELELAEARRVVAETAAGLADGPTVGVETGPRRDREGTGTDLAVDLELPFLRRSSPRASFGEALATAGRLLPAAAAVEGEAALATAYVDAWAAGRRVAVRGEDLATAQRWLAAARRRVEAGAEAPFEAELVAVEGEAARFALAAAQAEQRRAWATLAALATLPAEPTPLAAPALAPPIDPGDLAGRLAAGALARAALARRDLALAAAQVEAGRAQGRWALRSLLGWEGDEEVARLGVAWRVPRRGELGAAEAVTRAGAAASARTAELAIASLEARLAGAVALIAALTATSSTPSDPPPDVEGALAAVEARRVEGKSSPAEALAIRRQLLAAREAAIDRDAAVARANVEVAALTAEVTP